MPVNNNGNGAMKFGTYNDVNGNQNNNNTYNDQRKNNNNSYNYNNQRIAHGKNVINGDIKGNNNGGANAGQLNFS